MTVAERSVPKKNDEPIRADHQLRRKLGRTRPHMLEEEPCDVALLLVVLRLGATTTQEL